MKCEQIVQVRNLTGLHARPAATIAHLLQNSRSEVTLAHKDQVANGRSVIEMLMLSARKDDQITITIEGDDAQETMDRLVAAFESGLDVHI